MSVEIFWERLVAADVAEQTRVLLNAHLRQAEWPDVLGRGLEVTALDFGTVPPEVELVALEDPNRVFLEETHFTMGGMGGIGMGGIGMDGIGMGGGGERESRGRRQDASIHSDHTQQARDPHEQASPEQQHPEQQHLKVEHQYQPTNVQLRLRIRYQGDFRAQVKTELVLNTPTPGFLSLPLCLAVRELTVDGVLLVAYTGNQVHLSLTGPPPDDTTSDIDGDIGDGPFMDMKVESEIGDADKQVLKNVAKVERFLLDQCKRFLHDSLVFPSHHTIALVPARHASQGGLEGNNSVSGMSQDVD